IPPVPPRQYKKDANANAVQVEETSDDEDSMPSEEEQNRFLAKLAVLTSYYDPKTGSLVQRSVNAATTTSANTTEYHKLIFDTGADTCVIGSGWMVTQHYGPLVNLVGFDSVYA
ncbi:hypothetical protein, partial [Salmonella enterica]|uniref:hypothetical protein n=1 Tax=Salmonella enterica TaxID=28901 RepID=UPI0035250658